MRQGKSMCTSIFANGMHLSGIHSHQTELFLLGEPVDVGIDFRVGTSSPVGHHKKIDTSAWRDVSETAGIVCRESLNWDKDSSPTVENSLRARGQRKKQSTKSGGERVREIS